MNVNLMDADSDPRSRIVAAANELYARSGKFPSVAAVRQAAQVDMNTASTVMRDWRRVHQQPPTATAVPVPDAVVQAANVALSTVWNSAMDLAGEALRNAQAAWMEERSQTEQHLQQVVEAYDSQAAELCTTRESLHEVQRKLSAASDDQRALHVRLERYEEQLALYVADRDGALDAAARAREENARLSGQLEVLASQNTELLARLRTGPLTT